MVPRGKDSLSWHTTSGNDRCVRVVSGLNTFISIDLATGATGDSRRSPRCPRRAKRKLARRSTKGSNGRIQRGFHVFLRTQAETKCMKNVRAGTLKQEFLNRRSRGRLTPGPPVRKLPTFCHLPERPNTDTLSPLLAVQPAFERASQQRPANLATCCWW